MQAIEFTTEADTIHITIERNALNVALLAQVNEYLQGLMQPLEATSTISASTITASELRRLPPNERKRIIAEQFARASELYTKNPDALVEDASDWGDVYAR
jgi:hypothetical protein